jgi:hypothetical protein
MTNLSNCCFAPITLEDPSNGHGKCSDCWENTVPAEITIDDFSAPTVYDYDHKTVLDPKNTGVNEYTFATWIADGSKLYTCHIDVLDFVNFLDSKSRIVVDLNSEEDDLILENGFAMSFDDFLSEMSTYLFDYERDLIEYVSEKESKFERWEQPA